MYEHTVTLKYLHDHPDELQAFFDFDRVQQYRLMKPIFETFGEGVPVSYTHLDVYKRQESGKPVHAVTETTDLTAELKRGLSYVRHERRSEKPQDQKKERK